jgi:hypothetical protein
MLRDDIRQGKFQLEVLPDVGHYLHEVRMCFWLSRQLSALITL